ncbi:hypothetical protein DFH09DRAFT_1357336 [Mycena vulgaris]|nr:hypothetical protein DFH09DRAFT_1357336 [Mycena vulgaris]
MASTSESSAGNFLPLGRHAFIQRAASSPSTPDDTPTVIVIFSWMSAKLSHLHKYSAMYRKIYPHATLILVRSELSYIWATTSMLKARFRPVVEALEALGCLENRQRILTHTFSNGGSLRVLALARMLSAKPVDTQTFRPLSALIIDSSPGGDRLDRIQLAFTSSIRNILLRLIANGFPGSSYYGWAPTSWRPALDRRTLAKTVYLLKADEMVPWADVEENVAAAASEGLDVRRLRFDNSAHVAHARVHPKEYWAAVRNIQDVPALRSGAERGLNSIYPLSMNKKYKANSEQQMW